MDKEIVFYCFNRNNQKTKVIKCDSISQANELFNEEIQKFKKNQSKYTYFDITINGKTYRNSKNI